MLRTIWLAVAQLITVILALYGGYVLVTQSWTRTPTITSTHALADFSEATEKAAPSVVTILTRSNPKSTTEAPDTLTGLAAEHTLETLGSGIIISADGVVLTNHHVVSEIKNLIVALNDGQRFNATLLNQDQDTDLAVLKILANNLPAIEMCDPQSVRIGQPVIAIGNPFAVGQTVTAGIVSALGRHGFGLNNYEDFIQTDAAINQGNSGGALVNTQGQLVGINSAIFSPQQSDGFVGIGFAIPVSMIQKVLPGLLSGNRVERGYFGIVPAQLTPEFARDLGLPLTNGVIVNTIVAESPAKKAGLRPFDVIVKIGHNNIMHINQLLDIIANLHPGTTIPVQIYRGQQEMLIDIQVGPRPINPLQQSDNEAVTNVG